MEIETEFLERMSIDEFADKHGLTMKVVERDIDLGPAMRFYAYFNDAEVKLNGVYEGRFGDGATPEDAITDYAKRISLLTIVIDAYSASRREIRVPVLSCAPAQVKESDGMTGEEIAYNNGKRAVYAALLRTAFDDFGSELNADRWRIERMETLTKLRELCRVVGIEGGNDWLDTDSLPDVIENRLIRPIEQIGLSLQDSSENVA